MGDWNRSEMMCSHRYEKAGADKGSRRGVGVGICCHPAKDESFLLRERIIS
jgi:hypothetical protein